MLKIEKTVLPSADQWEIIIEGMRNPMNSWDRMDSYMTHNTDVETLESMNAHFFMGEKDHERAQNLADNGPVHGKYLRMIPVWVTLTAPMYWWKEFDTYKVGTVRNSCSTMHKITAKEFTLEDFSTEHLFNDYERHTVDDCDYLSTLDIVIDQLNDARKQYLKTKTEDAPNELIKKYWWQMIQLLPSSYNQKSTILVNYQVLANIYEYRKDHKLDEWHTFCDWIKTLPYSELIIGKEVK